MFRKTIRATEKTDIEKEVSDLQSQCDHVGLSSSDVALIISQTEQTLISAVARTRGLGSSGSQIHLKREISGEGYSVKIIFRPSSHKGFIQSVIDALWRRHANVK